MEVTVLSAQGAIQDPNSIISIRAASSRRQGAVQVGKPLQFPVGIEDANPFKVDVLRQLGSGSCRIKPEDGIYCVPVEAPVGKDARNPMGVKLKVTSDLRLCGRTRQELKGASSALIPPALLVTEEADNWSRKSAQGSLHENSGGDACGQDCSRKASSTEEARQYFDFHNIMRLVQALLEALIRDQPSEPFDYIGSFMGRLSHEMCQKGAGKAADSKQTAIGRGFAPSCSSDAVARRDHPDWLVSAFDNNDTERVGKLEEPAFSAAIRSVYANVSPAQALVLFRGVAPPSGGGANLAAFCAAASAVQEGDAYAAEVAGLSREQYLSLEARPFASSDMERTRMKMQGFLIDSLEDGSLEASLMGHANGKALAKAGEAPGVVVDIDGIRNRMKDLLVGSLEDGSLARSLSQTRDQRTLQEAVQTEDEVRDRMKGMLVDALEDGRLEEMLEQRASARVEPADANANPDETVRRIHQALLEAAEDGRLDKALKQCLPSEDSGQQGLSLEQMRDKTRQLLIDAQTDGSLEKALSQQLGAAPSVVESCDKNVASVVMNSLIAAASDGRLEESLKQNAASAQGVMKAPGEARDVAELKTRVRDMLEKTCESGELSKALSSIKESNNAAPLDGSAADVQALRNAARNLFMKASDEGTLAAALAEVKQEREAGLAQSQREQDTRAIDPQAGARGQADLRDHCALAAETLANAHKNGTLERTLMERCAEDLFEKIDTNRDNVIDRAELKQAVSQGVIAPGAQRAENVNQAPSRLAPSPPLGTVEIPKSPRHGELLTRQRELLEQRRMYEEQLKKLQDAKNATVVQDRVPVPPASKKPTDSPGIRRPRAAASQSKEASGFDKIREVNTGLTSENARLNAELSRLRARAAQASTR